MQLCSSESSSWGEVVESSPRTPGHTSSSMSLGNTETAGKTPKPRQLWWPKGPTLMPQISQITKQAAKQTQILDRLWNVGSPSEMAGLSMTALELQPQTWAEYGLICGVEAAGWLENAEAYGHKYFSGGNPPFWYFHISLSPCLPLLYLFCLVFTACASRCMTGQLEDMSQVFTGFVPVSEGILSLSCAFLIIRRATSGFNYDREQ